MSEARRAKTSKASKTSKTSNNLAPAPAGGKRRLASALALTSLTGLTALMLTPAAAQPGAAKEHETPSRPHVYLLRGLMNIFSLGMDQLAAKIGLPRASTIMPRPTRSWRRSRHSTAPAIAGRSS
jgi:hypothetical protein